MDKRIIALLLGGLVGYPAGKAAAKKYHQRKNS